jgi:hypothetical protein
MKIVFAFSILILTSVGCSEKVETAAPAQKVVSNVHNVAISLTEDRAVEIISELPETKAWASYIERKTESKVHAAIMVLPDGLKDVTESNTGLLAFMRVNQQTFIYGSLFW